MQAVRTPIARAAALAALLLLAGPAVAAAAQGPADDFTLPLVYVFSADALDGSRAIEQGLAPFTTSLVSGRQGGRGTYYRESRGVMVSETNPNHVAMATGAFGDTSGIPGNAFAVYDQEAKAACGADASGDEGGDPPGLPAEQNPTGPAAPTDGETAQCAIAESFFTALAKGDQRSRVTTAGIFGKPKLARIFATKRVAPPLYDADHLWTPCAGEGDDPDFCRPVPLNPINGYALDDGVVMDEVLRAVREGVPESGGALNRPNLTFVNFPQVDGAGHAAGARLLYDTAVGLFDAQLQRFVEQQKALGLWDRTTIFLISDHSMDTTLQKTSLGQRFAPADADRVEIIQNGSVDMVYLKDRSAPDRFELLARLRATALGTEGVDEALYRQANPADGGDAQTLDRVHPGWNIAGERTGDLFVTHDAAGAFSDPVNPLVGNHGSPLTTDNTFAVISGGPQVRQQALSGEVGARFDDTLINEGQAQNVDVAPTVNALFGVQPPADNEGRVLTEAFDQTFVPQLFEIANPCVPADGFDEIIVEARGRELRLSFARGVRVPVQIDVFQQSRGRTLIGNRLVARFDERTGGLVWSGRANRDGRSVTDGYFFVRYTMELPTGRTDVRRVPVRRVRGRWDVRPAFYRRDSCGRLPSFKLERPVVGGRNNRPASVSFRVRDTERVRVDVFRGDDRVRRLSDRIRNAGSHRVRLSPEGLGRGDHTVRLIVGSGPTAFVTTLTIRRL